MSAKTALVVDDSKSARFALRRYLENHQYKVETAESAEEAYNMLRAHRPEVIFLDHVMPGTDGFEALKHIKSDPATGSIPVVICSSNEGAQFTEDARTQGATHVLQKPPSPERLSAILASLQKFSAELREPDPDLKFADTGKYSSDGKQDVPPAALLTPAAPSKVSNIREPEVAIEQAVMKALRGAIQSRADAAAAPPPTPPPPAPAAPAAADPSQLNAMREQMEARLKKITQDMFVQMAELKGSLTHLEAQVDSNAKSTRPSPADAAVAAMIHRLDALEKSVNQQLGELRKQMEAGVASQAERISQITQAARAAAAQEAHAVAERTVMSAAGRISDQLSESILKAISAK